MKLLRSSAKAQKVPASWRHRKGSLCQKLNTFGVKPGSHLAVELGFFLVRSRVVSQGSRSRPYLLRTCVHGSRKRDLELGGLVLCVMWAQLAR